MSFLMYFLKANITMAVLSAFYMLVVRKHTFHALNRVYILFCCVVTIVLPLIEFPFSFESLTPIPAHNVVILPVLSHVPLETHAVLMWMQWQFWVLVLLGAGFVVCLFKLLTQLVGLWLHSRQARVKYIDGHKFFMSDEVVGPFSFFNSIYVNPSLFTEQELSEVLVHEKAHVEQLHSIDILLLEIFRCIFWINPFMHILRKEARQNLEYLADRKVVKSGFDEIHYQYTLLKVADSKILPVIVSEFRMSNLKKRIVMINKPKASKLSLIRYGLVIPLLGLLWFFAAPARAQEPNKNEKNKTEVTTTILKVNGAGKVEGEDEPLLIVNGEEVAGNFDLNTISANNIVSVSVLKGGDAIKQYGDKGKNGVILITTKDGSNIEVFSLNQEDGEKMNTSVSVTTVAKDGTVVTMMTKNSNDGSLPENAFYIVDGKEEISKVVEQLDVDNIKSVSVLKGNAATDIYGEKGENGVMIFTMKKDGEEDIVAFEKIDDNDLKNIDVKSEDVNVSISKLSSNPLFVIDGRIATSEDMKQLNSEDIESIAVLKGEAATALYGESAADGALIITMKKKK